MSRLLRITIPNIPFHILNRGNNRQKVFLDEGDFDYFTSLLKRFKDELEFKLYHFYLMPNYIHFLMEPTIRRFRDYKKSELTPFLPFPTEELSSIAFNRWSEYKELLRQYKQRRDLLFRGLRPRLFMRESKVESVINVVNNFTRMGRDLFRSLKNRIPGNDIGLKNSHIKVRVLNRTELLEDRGFTDLIKDNGSTVRNLLDKEVFREINCTNILLLEGLTLEQLHLLVRKLGHNPSVIFSDPRKEKLRFAIDNELNKKGEHPFSDEINGLHLTNEQLQSELSYYKPVFTGILSKLPGLSRWHVSRTHGLVYVVKKDNEKVFLIPVHVDPKNAILVFSELFSNRYREEKKAIAYHQTAEGRGENYIGTGLFDLGCVILIRLLKRAEKSGLIKKLEIGGENKLKTSYSIYIDDQVTKKIEELVVVQNKRIT